MQCSGFLENLFQFNCCAIKGAKNFRARRRSGYFNSTVVRLKEGETFENQLIHSFQFNCCAIKGDGNHVVVDIIYHISIQLLCD